MRTCKRNALARTTDERGKGGLERLVIQWIDSSLSRVGTRSFYSDMSRAVLTSKLREKGGRDEWDQKGERARVFLPATDHAARMEMHVE